MELLSNSFVSSKVDPTIGDRLLGGNLWSQSCACGFTGIVPGPKIYFDPKMNLCVFVCDGDRESLIDEFHNLLDASSSQIPNGDLQHIKANPFQIVIGLPALAKIVYALTHGFDCHRFAIGFCEEPLLFIGMFLVPAKFYRLAGKHQEAYMIVHTAYELGYRDSRLHRELGAYAFTAGKLDSAEQFLTESIRMTNQQSHNWQKIVIPQGSLFKIDDEVNLPILTDSVRALAEQKRPEFCFDNSTLGKIGGTLLAIYNQTANDLGPHPKLSHYQGHIDFILKTILKDNNTDADQLVREIKETQTAVAENLRFEDWARCGLMKSS